VTYETRRLLASELVQLGAPPGESAGFPVVSSGTVAEGFATAREPALMGGDPHEFVPSASARDVVTYDSGPLLTTPDGQSQIRRSSVINVSIPINR
jgi:hypothetical protein